MLGPVSFNEKETTGDTEGSSCPPQDRFCICPRGLVEVRVWARPRRKRLELPRETLEHWPKAAPAAAAASAKVDFAQTHAYMALEGHQIVH